jgi:Fe-S cluster assembly ATP-binding protein
MIKLSSYQACVDERVILEGVSVDFTPRQLVLLRGDNGAGKSTFLKGLFGLGGVASTGVMELEGEDVTSLPTHQKVLRGMFLVSQHVPAVPGLTVIQLLRELIQTHGLEYTTSELLERVKEYQQVLHLPEDFYKREVHVDLSGGQQKRLEMLQVMILKPRYLFLDEIDSGLDQEGKEIFSQVLQGDLKNSFRLIVSHNQDFCDFFSFDKVYEIRDSYMVEV